MRFACCVLLMLGIGSVAMAEDENWNQFLGPRANATSTAKDLPVSFGEDSPGIRWKTPIPGRGWSSPVIWGKQVWMTYGPEVVAVKEKMPVTLDKPLKVHAVCVDLDSGKVVYDLFMFDIYKPQITHETNSYASCTPYVEEGRAYVHFGGYGSACIDTRTGQKLWERNDLPCDHFRGPGSSVAVYGDLVYLTLDGYDQQYIVALNKHTGDTVWKRDRNVDFGTTDGDAKKAFSTPVLFNIDGRQELVSPFASATIAYEPKTGDPIWVAHHGGINGAGRPLYGNGLLYINSADGPHPLLALKPGTGDISKNMVWSTNKSTPKRACEVLVGDLLFMMNDGGVASCLDALTGKIIWSKRLHGEYWSSPLYANGLIYCCSQTGDVIVFKAARELEVVAENKLGSGFNASPAVAGDALILRSKTHLYRIEKTR